MAAKKKSSYQDLLRGTLSNVIDLEARERLKRLTEEPSPGDQTDEQAQTPPKEISTDATLDPSLDLSTGQTPRGDEQNPSASDYRKTSLRNEEVSGEISEQPANPAIDQDPLEIGITRESTTEPETKPHTKPDSRPVSQSAAQKTTQSAARPVSQPEEQPEGLTERPSDPHTATHTTTRSVSQSASHSSNQSYGLTENQSSNRSLGASVSPSEDLSLGASISHSESQSLNPSLRQSIVADRLTQGQQKVLSFLLESKPYIVKFREIGACIGLGEATVRTILRRLMVLNFLSFKKARDGNLQGIKITFNQELCNEFIQGLSISHSGNQSDGLSQNHSLSQSFNQSINQRVNQLRTHSDDQTLNQPDSRPVSQPTEQLRPLKIDRKNNLSIDSKEEFGWSEDFIRLNWPLVHEAGFGEDQVAQATENLVARGKKPDRNKFSLSLDHAEWELENIGQLTDSKGRPVKNPASFIFRALAQWGWFRAHPDYVSPEEEALKQAEEELGRLEKARKRLEEARFESWKGSLTRQQLAKILENRRGPEDVWLRNFYRENVEGEGDGAGE